jgi:hypothetical protein
MLFFKLLFVLLLLLSSPIYANAYFAVIVSKKSNIQEMSKQDVSRIFLSKTKELPNGQKAITIEPNAIEYQEIFYKEVCEKTQQQLKKYWAAVLFTGKGQPPRKIQKVEDIIEFVKNNNNAIAYIPAAALTSDEIKIILEIH